MKRQGKQRKGKGNQAQNQRDPNKFPLGRKEMSSGFKQLCTTSLTPAPKTSNENKRKKKSKEKQIEAKRCVVKPKDLYVSRSESITQGVIRGVGKMWCSDKIGLTQEVTAQFASASIVLLEIYFIFISWMLVRYFYFLQI